MRTDNKSVSAGSGREEKTHAKERQEERVEVPEHEILKDLPPFQGIGDIRMFLLGLFIGTCGIRLLLALFVGGRWFQPFTLRDLDLLQNVMQRNGLESSQLDELPDVYLPR